MSGGKNEIFPPYLIVRTKFAQVPFSNFVSGVLDNDPLRSSAFNYLSLQNSYKRFLWT